MTSKNNNDENINLKINNSTSEVPKLPSGTQPEKKGFWNSLFGDSSESDESLNQPEEKGFWSSLFGDSSDSSDNEILPTGIENIKSTGIETTKQEKNLTNNNSNSDEISKVKSELKPLKSDFLETGKQLKSDFSETGKQLKSKLKPLKSDNSETGKQLKSDNSETGKQLKSKLKPLKSDFLETGKQLKSDNSETGKQLKSDNSETGKSMEIPIINSNNNDLNHFLGTFCKSKYTINIIHDIYDEIAKNQELYENETFRISNLKYRLCNKLTNYEKIHDFFFDIGHNNLTFSTNLNDFKVNNILIDNNQIREIIVFDPIKDNNLNKINEQILNIPKDNNIYKVLIEIILNNLGNETEDFKFNKFILTHANKIKSNILYIGELDIGIDRHKSLLFKYLCDKLNLPCCIFRYVSKINNKIFDKHVWNLIKIDNCIYVVDFKNFPNRIVKPTNIETEKYYRIKEFIQ